MDPALFRINWDVLLEVFGVIVVLAFFVERMLSLVFEHRYFVRLLDEKGVKEPIAFAVALGIVRYWNFDALSIILNAEAVSWWGQIVTAAIIAGGSKASIKLFHDVMGARSTMAKASSTAKVERSTAALRAQDQ